ncbi:MAG: hypothetical protein JJ902_14745 [Roseibium sp.]|nr:hypothetical protein [Roseibium sp.]
MKRRHRTIHARVWFFLAVVLPLAFLTILSMRQTTPLDRPAVLIEAPGGEVAR